MRLQPPRLVRVVTRISKTNPRAVGRAIVIDIQTFGSAVICRADVEFTWLFGRGDYRPDEAAISAWRGMEAVCFGVGMGLEGVGWAQVVVG